MRLNGTTLPQALLNPPFIVQGYITASGGRCALYRCAGCFKVYAVERVQLPAVGGAEHCICCSRVRLAADDCTAPRIWCSRVQLVFHDCSSVAW